MEANRVVITGLGVCAPNGNTVPEFLDALRGGKSGVRFQPDLERLGFGCQIAGLPQLDQERIGRYFSSLELKALDSSGIVYGVIAGMDAWADAGLQAAGEQEPDWDSGAVMGTGTSGIDKFRWAINQIDAHNVRRLGSTVVSQTMNSGVSAFLSGKLGLGNRVVTNSSACATGTESVLMAYEHIRSGRSKRMLAGSTSDSGPYIWGGFDAMRVCTSKYNDRPEKGSRPMSGSANGFVPGSGAGALVLESLESARERGARIYGEVLGGDSNSGGQRGGGSMTAANAEAVQRCISGAIANAGISAEQIQLISGHLTATTKDAQEIANWKAALDLSPDEFPLINSIKGMTGHCISASGSIECVASALELYHGFVFPNLNCEDLDPAIVELIGSSKIPLVTTAVNLDIVAKASFGFGDVNACIIFKKYYHGS